MSTQRAKTATAGGVLGRYSLSLQCCDAEVEIILELFVELAL